MPFRSWGRSACKSTAAAKPRHGTKTSRLRSCRSVARQVRHDCKKIDDTTPECLSLPDGSVLIWWRRCCGTAVRRGRGAPTLSRLGHYLEAGAVARHGEEGYSPLR